MKKKIYVKTFEKICSILDMQQKFHMQKFTVLVLKLKTFSTQIIDIVLKYCLQIVLIIPLLHQHIGKRNLR